MDTKQRDFEKENRLITLILWLFLCCCSMAVMLWFAAHKTIVIADVPREQSGLTTVEVRSEQELLLRRTEAGEGSFRIPLPGNVKAENVVMENHYVEQELWIYVQSEDAHFYEVNEICGDVSSVLQGRFEVQPDGILLKLFMDGIREYRSTMEGNSLEITGYAPESLYTFVVVLDPAGGGSESGVSGYGCREKDIALEVARLVQKKLAVADVKLYLTRTEDVQVSEADRVALVKEVGADLYIGLGVTDNPDNPENYGILSYYNEEYFIPEFGNADLADIVTKEVTISSSNRAVGLSPAGEESILKDISVPAVQLSLGYLSNEQERSLLQQESYLEKLADGILTAISESCGILEGLQE